MVGSKNCCASHDFCDPNEAMAQALQAFGVSFSPFLCEGINEAWELAQKRGFDAG